MSITLIQELSGHKDRVWAAKWSHCGNILASCSSDKDIRLWKKEKSGQWKCIAILADGHTRTIRNLAWSSNDDILASCSFDSLTCIWTYSDSWVCNLSLEGHEHEVKSVSWSHDARFLATCSRDKTIWIWENIDNEYECASVIDAHTGDVKKVLFHPTENILASCSYDNTIKFHKEEDDDWTCFQSLNHHESTVWSIDFNSNGTKMVSCSDDLTIRIYFYDSKWNLQISLSGYHNRPIYDVSWIDDYILSCSGDNSICIFKVNSDNAILLLHQQVHDNDINGVQWNPKHPYIFVTCSDEGSIKLWEFKPDTDMV